jgi:hypothetical protein
MPGMDMPIGGFGRPDATMWQSDCTCPNLQERSQLNSDADVETISGDRSGTNALVRTRMLRILR